MMKQMDIQDVEHKAIESLAAKLTVLACGVFAIYVFFAIFSLRCLYADGSFQLTETLKAGGFVFEGQNRYSIWFIEQLPAVALIKLGVTRLYYLQIAYGLGCFLPWAVTMILCHWMAPRHFWLVMLGCASGYLNSCFMAVLECNTANAFFWPVLFAVLFVRPLTPLAAGIMTISALILVFSYESLLFLGPPLCFLAAERAFQKGEEKWARMVFALSSALLLLAALVALNTVLYPQFSGEFGGFRLGIERMFLHPTWTMGWTFIWIFLMGVVCFGRQNFTKRYFRLKLSLLAAAIAVWGFWPILDPSHLKVERQFDDRPIQLLVALTLLMVAWVMTRKPKWFDSCRHHLVAFSASLLLAQSIWQITATWQWNGFVGLWRGVLASRYGLVSLSGTPLGNASLSGQCLSFDWSWANPTLSIMLAPHGRVQSMILPPEWETWQPFNPMEPTDFPKLQKYGIDYSNYVGAILKQKAEDGVKLPTQQFFHVPGYSILQ